MSFVENYPVAGPLNRVKLYSEGSAQIKTSEINHFISPLTIHKMFHVITFFFYNRVTVF